MYLSVSWSFRRFIYGFTIGSCFPALRNNPGNVCFNGGLPSSFTLLPSSGEPAPNSTSFPLLDRWTRNQVARVSAVNGLFGLISTLDLLMDTSYHTRPDHFNIGYYEDVDYGTSRERIYTAGHRDDLLPSTPPSPTFPLRPVACPPLELCSTVKADMELRDTGGLHQQYQVRCTSATRDLTHGS